MLYWFQPCDYRVSGLRVSCIDKKDATASVSLLPRYASSEPESDSLNGTSYIDTAHTVGCFRCKKGFIYRRDFLYNNGRLNTVSGMNMFQGIGFAFTVM